MAQQSCKDKKANPSKPGPEAMTSQNCKVFIGRLEESFR